MLNFVRLESSTQLAATQPIVVARSEAFALQSGVAAESEVDVMTLRSSGDPVVPRMALHLRPGRVTRMLAFIAFALFVAYAGVVVAFYFDRPTVKGFVPLFDVEAELNIPTFFSTLILLIAASLTAVIHTLERRLNAAHAVMWAVLAGGFFFMAFDEAFSVHDRYWGRFARSMFPDVDFGGSSNLPGSSSESRWLRFSACCSCHFFAAFQACCAVGSSSPEPSSCPARSPSRCSAPIGLRRWGPSWATS